MRISIFSGFDPKLNPYILLFKKSLEHQGCVVSLEYVFNLKWVMQKSRDCDCIHLHWLKLFHTLPKMFENSNMLKDLAKNRIISTLLDSLRLAEFVISIVVTKLMGKKIVFTIHDMFKEKKKSLRWNIQTQIAHHIIFYFANSIHVHNHFSKKNINSNYKRNKNIFVIPHSNFIGYYPNKITKIAARRKLDIEKDAFVYMFLGLIRPYKGVENLIEAFNTINLPEKKLIIAGRVFRDKKYESILFEKAKDNNKIKYMPIFIPDRDIQIYLNACDIFVLPYKHINTSGAAFLALSFGVPIIAPSIASFPEVINDDVGILYNPDKSDGLVNSLKDASIKSWSKEKIIRCANKYDWDELGAKFIKMYHAK